MDNQIIKGEQKCTSDKRSSLSLVTFFSFDETHAVYVDFSHPMSQLSDTENNDGSIFFHRFDCYIWRMKGRTVCTAILCARNPR